MARSFLICLLIAAAPAVLQAIQLVECPAGTYDKMGECVDCKVGKYCPAGAKNPEKCPKGTYNDQTGQSTCKVCPVNYYCDKGSKEP